MFKLVTVVIPAFSLGGYLSYNHWNHSSVNAAEKKLELDHVQFIFRHGARTPTVNLTYLNDIPNIEEAVWDKETFMKTLPFADIDSILKYQDGTDAKDSIVETYYVKRGALKVHLHIRYIFSYVNPATI